MQELSLYAYAPPSRQPTLSKVLSGISGMGADSFLTHHLLYKPKHAKPLPGVPSSGELYYIQLYARVTPEKDKKPPTTAAEIKKTEQEEKDANEGYKLRKQQWTIRFEDLPEVTKKPVVSRYIMNAPVYMGDGVELVEALGYRLVRPYFTENFRWIHGNIVITLSRTLLPPPPQPETVDGVYGDATKRGEMKMLDESEGWSVKAEVRVLNPTDVESIGVAMNELRVLQGVLRGVCDLEVVERLALDPRVR